MDEYTDDEIISKLQSANRRHHDEALYYLYEQHYQFVASFIIKNNGKEKDAEDTFQDAIIIFFNQVKSGRLKLKVSLKTYLFSIARNIWLKNLRDQKKATRLTERHEYIAIDEHSIAEELEFDELAKAVQRLLSQLGQECQQILRYFYLEKVRIKEIMSLLDYTSVQSVKNKKGRCIQKLKDKLGQNHLFDDFF